MPFQRPNLVSGHIKRLRLMMHTQPLPAEDVEPHLGRYGTSYSRAKTPHIINGALLLTQNPGIYHITIEYRVSDWGKPPPDYKHPDSLWDFAKGGYYPHGIDVSGRLRYPTDEWRSLIATPLDLREGLGDDPPFTHVEATKFSRREDDEVKYSVTVERLDSDIDHVVDFKSDEVLSDTAFADLAEKCKRLSRLFVRPNK